MSMNVRGELTLKQMMQRFSTEEAAREYFEFLRWPDGPYCAHCGNADQSRIYRVTPNPGKKIRPGLYKCAECKRGFTVTINTIMKDTHIPLNKWLIAFYMVCASRTRVSALRLQRQLELGSYKSALSLHHRIRYALKDAETSDRERLSSTVETFGRQPGAVQLVRPHRASKEDRQDAEIAQRRLVEVALKPDEVMRGKALEERLERWQA